MDVSGSGAATEVMPMASGGGGGGNADDDEMGADDEAATKATPAGAEARGEVNYRSTRSLVQGVARTSARVVLASLPVHALC